MTTPFSIGIELPTQVPPPPALFEALRAMGIGYVNYYVKPWESNSDETAAAVNEAMLALTAELGLEYSLACYAVDPPASEVARAQAADPKAFQGVVFDELAHCRLLNAHSPQLLANPETFTSLQDAYEKTLVGFESLHDKFAAMDCPAVATHVWPVLLHPAAQAGFIPCPKICKEFYSPVSLAIGMGAALQYERPLWVNVDMWYWDLVPGHPPEEVLSNLKLAYWLGAGRVYLEGAGHNLTPPGASGTPFSLVNVIRPGAYQLTAHGQMLRRFCTEYVPDHPRAWTFRDVKPDIAIVRFPDSDYGQRSLVRDWFATGLYGTEHLASTQDTRAWFQIWNLLTFGATGTAGLSYLRADEAAWGYEAPVEEGVVQSLYSRPAQAGSHDFFVPLNGAVVFDHQVTYQHLRDIPLLFLTGVDVSVQTAEDLLRCAGEGAVLVVWHSLAERLGLDYPGQGMREIPRGQGAVIVVDDYSYGDLFQRLQPLLGQPDHIRYRFEQGAVTLKRIDSNRVEVVVDTP